MMTGCTVVDHPYNLGKKHPSMEADHDHIQPTITVPSTDLDIMIRLKRIYNF
jgi:hypothetical protein